MRELPSLQFNDMPVTRAQFVAAARAYKGFPYVIHKAWANEDLSDPGAPATGVCDCAGLPLLACRRVGLLPSDWPVDVPAALFGRAREDVLGEIIKRNLHRIEISEAGAGDFLFLAYPGVEAHQRGGKHIAIKTGDEPKPHGSIIHAWCDPNGRGSVFEQRLTAADMKCIKAAWRLNALIKGDGE